MSIDLAPLHRTLAQRLSALHFTGPVAYTYNPLQYAWLPLEKYLNQWAGQTGRVLLLGMNPGPFGMAQTGVPFGDVSYARDWLRTAAPVQRPPAEHPARPVVGYALKRSEGSGKRLWGWAEARFGTPERFFAQFVVLNYCPLLFLDDGGRNVTPDKLLAPERAALESTCDESLAAMVRLLAPSQIFGIGGYAAQSTRRALGDGFTVGQLLHPSPANPAANRDWVGTVERQLREAGVVVPDGGSAPVSVVDGGEDR
ncbi:MAG: single-stranded DNA-binding protein [Myxococcales bacterium]|nr:single-stranded DNA-binding protein [Myxococcales bacterium]